MVEFLDFRKADVDLRSAFALSRLQQLGQAVQGLRAKDHIHIRGAGNDLLAFLTGHAAAHANHHALVFQVLDPSQVRKHLFLRFLAH